MGADKGIHVTTEERTDQGISPLAVAKIIAHFAGSESADVVIVGKQAIDGDNAQTGPMVAGLLGWSQGTFACAAEFSGEVCRRTICCIITAAVYSHYVYFSNSVLWCSNPSVSNICVCLRT
jgi:hypothetical protein